MTVKASDYLRRNILGLVAIFLALGGTAYAANTISSVDIIDGQVKTPDLAAGSVVTGKVLDGSLSAADLGTASVKTPEIAAGAVTASKVAGNSLGGDQINEAGLAGSYRLPQSCANGQVAKSNGAGVWNCAVDGGGTTYSARANGGLALASNAFGLVPCPAGQVLKSTGSSNWACATDNTGTGGPPTGAAGGDLAGTYPNPTIGVGKVNSAKVADESLTLADIKDESLTGHDIQDDTIGGADVNESLLDYGISKASFSSHNPADFVVGQNATQVIALTDSAGVGGRSGGLLDLPFNARVVVDGSVSFKNPSPHFVYCQANIAPAGGSYTPISQATTTYSVDAQAPISAAVDVGPGIYNVQVACWSSTPTAVQFDRGDITAVAISR